MRLNLEELLLDENLVLPGQLQAARSYQQQEKVTLGKALVSLGLVADDAICGLVSRHCGLPSINLEPATVDPVTLAAIPAEMAKCYQVLPLFRSGAALTVAIADPTNELALEHVRLVTGCVVKPVVASESALEQAIALCYGKARSAERRRDTERAEACARCERTAWQYVTLMHAAAVGGARRPTRGIVEDVEDMRSRLTRERDEARARVAELEMQLAASTAANGPRPGRPPSAPPG